MIEVKNAVKKFEDFTALDGISLTIPDESIFGMVGSNGAGKSTLMRILAGIYKQDGGEVLLDGQQIWENPETKKKIVFVSDDLYDMSGASMDRLAKLYQSVYETFSTEVYEKLKEYFKLPGNKSLNKFSKGMKRQAITILALSCQTQYLFFDETFDGLDPVMRNLVKSLICEDIIKRKATAVITSHSLRELEDTCDQLALMHKGGIVLQSDIGNLKTSLFKIQIAFRESFDKTKFTMLDKILHYSQHGSVANLIVRGEKEEMLKKLALEKPVLLEIIPLTLEEVFTYEMEALGYSFQDILK